MSEVSDEYEVEKIIDKKIEDSIVLFKVKWKGHLTSLFLFVS